MVKISKLNSNSNFQVNSSTHLNIPTRFGWPCTKVSPQGPEPAEPRYNAGTPTGWSLIKNIQRIGKKTHNPEKSRKVMKGQTQKGRSSFACWKTFFFAFWRFFRTGLRAKLKLVRMTSINGSSIRRWKKWVSFFLPKPRIKLLEKKQKLSPRASLINVFGPAINLAANKCHHGTRPRIKRQLKRNETERNPVSSGEPDGPRRLRSCLVVLGSVLQTMMMRWIGAHPCRFCQQDQGI